MHDFFVQQLFFHLLTLIQSVPLPDPIFFLFCVLTKLSQAQFHGPCFETWNAEEFQDRFAVQNQSEGAWIAAFTRFRALLTRIFTPVDQGLFTPSPRLFTPGPRLFTPGHHLFARGPRLFTPVPAFLLRDTAYLLRTPPFSPSSHLVLIRY